MVWFGAVLIAKLREKLEKMRSKPFNFDHTILRKDYYV